MNNTEIINAAKALTLEDCLRSLPIHVANRFLRETGNWRSPSEALGQLKACFWASNPHSEGHLNARVISRDEVIVRAIAIYLIEGGNNPDGELNSRLKTMAPESVGDGEARHEGELF